MKVYDPDQISIVFAGIPIQGYADGEFIRIETQTEDFTSKVGTDGEVTRSKTNDRRGLITIMLEQTSPTNAALSALRNTDINTPGGAGIGALLVRDRLNGDTLYRASEAWIQKLPDSSFDRESTTREWVLECAKLEANIAGN